MIIYFGIGSNIGDREANLRRAIELLHERVGECMEPCTTIVSPDFTRPTASIGDTYFIHQIYLS